MVIKDEPLSCALVVVRVELQGDDFDTHGQPAWHVTAVPQRCWLNYRQSDCLYFCNVVAVDGRFLSVYDWSASPDYDAEEDGDEFFIVDEVPLGQLSLF